MGGRALFVSSWLATHEESSYINPDAQWVNVNFTVRATRFAQLLVPPAFAAIHFTKVGGVK